MMVSIGTVVKNLETVVINLLEEPPKYVSIFSPFDNPNTGSRLFSKEPLRHIILGRLLLELPYM